MLHAVITTIQSPTPSVIRLSRFLSRHNGRMVVAGDTKGPSGFDLSASGSIQSAELDFLSIDDQMRSNFSIAQQLPTGHYCRKNVGYLHAIACGASCIYETDDDNAPLDTWRPRDQWVDSPRFALGDSATDPHWINVYRFFSNDLIWPRGLPLDQIREESRPSNQLPKSITAVSDSPDLIWAPIQQGLADSAPDVDAIWRLVLDRDFSFDAGESVMLAPGQWCPFNTQTTWWWPAAFPLLYVPSFCSFRMCDIWKSFVAQRCLWELGTGVVFHPSEVIQERNPHSLMRDFEDEISGYLGNHTLAALLDSLELKSGPQHVGGNLRTCYEAMTLRGFFPEKELRLVDAWLSDLETIDSRSERKAASLPVNVIASPDAAVEA